MKPARKKIEYASDRLAKVIEFWEGAIENRAQRIAMRKEWAEYGDCSPDYWKSRSLPPPVRLENFPALPTEVQNWLDRCFGEKLDAIVSRVRTIERASEKVVGQHDPDAVKEANRLDLKLVDEFKDYVSLLINSRDIYFEELDAAHSKCGDSIQGTDERELGSCAGEETLTEAEGTDGRGTQSRTQSELREERNAALLERFDPHADRHPTYEELRKWLFREEEEGKRGWPALESDTGIRGALTKEWEKQHPDDPKWPFDNRGKSTWNRKTTKKRNSGT